MRHRILLLLVCSLLCFGITGCGNQIADLTDEQSEQVSEYAAAVLLAYDSEHHSRLLNDEQIAEAEKLEAIQKEREEAIAEIAKSYTDEKNKTDSKKDKEEQGTKGEETFEEPVVLADFLQLKGLDIKYDGASLEDSYPASQAVEADDTNAFFSMRASSGNKLLVVKFKITNVTGEDQTLDILSKKVRFSLGSDKLEKKNTLVTMLEDDFSTYNGVVPAGGTIYNVLITEIGEQQGTDIGNLKLYVKYNEDNATINLQ